MTKLKPVEYLETDKAPKEYFRPDWSMPCDNCGASPIVPITGLCGPCCFGEAETANGEWWDDKKDEMK